MKIRVSSGTAHVLGLKKVKSEILPTTAYLLMGDKCLRSCSFCSRSAKSTCGDDFLSRVTWPVFELNDVLQSLPEVYNHKRLHRACMQVVQNPGASENAKYIIKKIKQYSSIPVSASCYVFSLQDLSSWFESGADRIGIALDAANERVFKQVKGGSFEKTISLLRQAAIAFPNQISTHLIVGLGETDRELMDRIQEMADLGVTVGLFAFTPVRGTQMQDLAQPGVLRYRRVQAGLFLLKNRYKRSEDFSYSQSGALIDFGYSPEELFELLDTGQAFQTTGCPMCNRPFYNERPGGAIYNFAQELSTEELQSALSCLKFQNR